MKIRVTEIHDATVRGVLAYFGVGLVGIYLGKWLEIESFEWVMLYGFIVFRGAFVISEWMDKPGRKLKETDNESET